MSSSRRWWPTSGAGWRTFCGSAKCPSRPTADVLAATVDGLLLHRGLGSRGTGTATVLRRLVT
ncbi:hypothetical protein AB0E63_07570 [Kribbella sp. NPDC026596]|uniref:hypothetical protein n=1 Tax=Kribbella sp. NPDC026596 TaxID=3155122 RepID=UPI0033EB5149